MKLKEKDYFKRTDTKNDKFKVFFDKKNTYFVI